MTWLFTAEFLTGVFVTVFNSRIKWL